MYTFTILDHKQKYTFIHGHGLHICVSTIVRQANDSYLITD